MHSKFLLIILCAWNFVGAQVLLEAQPYGVVVSAVTEAETNLIVMSSQLDQALYDAITAAAQTIIENPAEVIPSQEITVEGGEGNVYIIRGETPLPNEANLIAMGIQVRALPEDFPEALVITDFKNILAAAADEAGTLASFPWDTVALEEPIETVIQDFGEYWKAASP